MLALCQLEPSLYAQRVQFCTDLFSKQTSRLLQVFSRWFLENVCLFWKDRLLPGDTWCYFPINSDLFMTFGGGQFLGKVTIVLNAFYLYTICLKVDLWSSKVFEMALQPCPACWATITFFLALLICPSFEAWWHRLPCILPIIYVCSSLTYHLRTCFIC